VIDVDRLSVADVVDLVNEFADRTRDAAGEADDPYPHLDLPGTVQVSRSGLVAVANELHRVFAEPDQAAELLNAAADRYGLRHRVGPDGHLAWACPEASSRLACATTAALIDVVAQRGLESLGICRAHDCVDIFVDGSRARSRSYCSPRCNNKARVARWRARQVSDRTIESDRSGQPSPALS
jgi:predicted RNA-binding Zn ribbon-like protein